MFAKVHPSSDVKSGNRGSCQDLADYLTKEEGAGQHFFSHNENEVSREKVIFDIDNNKKSLGNQDAKFFMLSLNPSEAEQRFLIGRDINDISELTPEEKQSVFRKLEEFTRLSMDDYACNFGRETIQSGNDLMYFARIETERHYHPTDEAVKEGTAKTGDVKPGLNMHVHVIVSRKSADGKVKLSPEVKSTGNEWELEGRGKVKRGFSHENWKVQVQDTFNRNFNYQSNEAETYKVKETEDKRTIIEKVSNPDLKNLLENHQFTAANQIVASMRERGYGHSVRKGIHTFKCDYEVFQISHKDLKVFETVLSDEQLKNIVSRFDLAKFENSNGHYHENNLQVKDISFSTLQKEEGEETKTLKSVSYKVIYDAESKTTVPLSAIRQYAYENKINLMQSELDKETILRKMKNADMKDLLTNYRFTAANQIVVAMKEQGYEHSIRKGVHTFTHPENDTFSILHKDLSQFATKIDDATMHDIIDRFNLYKFNIEHGSLGYVENDLSSKEIAFKTYVKERIEELPQLQDKPERSDKDIQRLMFEELEGRTEIKYRKVLKDVGYSAIYDDKTKTTVPVSLLRKFAYENKINLMNRFKHSYAVGNPDLRECLQNGTLINVSQINAEMRSRGYVVTKDENKNYVYTKGESSFSMAKRDLRAFTDYAKDNGRERRSSSHAGQIGVKKATSMVGGNIQSKVINEILGDNFRTERMLAGKVKTVVNIVQNPASIKMQLLKQIGKFLNPFKEL